MGGMGGPGGMDMASMMAGMGETNLIWMTSMATATTRISLIWSRKYPFFCIYKIFTLGLALDLRLHRCDYQKSTYSMFKHFSFVLFVLSTSVPCEMAFCFQVRSLES